MTTKTTQRMEISTGKTRIPEMVKRILTSLVAAPVFLFITWLGGWYFTGTLIIITMIVQLEMMKMLEIQGLAVRKVMALLIGIPVLLFPVCPIASWMFFLLLLLLLFLIETFGSDNRGWTRLITTIFTGLLIPALVSGLVFLRNTGDDTDGFLITLTLIAMVWSNDTFAFFGGKLMGRHALAPGISPSKTVEGFVWGFMGTFMAMFLCLLFIPDYPLGWTVAVLFAVITALFGPAGDLAESRLKRAAGFKDSSGIMPGHGGMFDRFDALLFAAPAAAILFYILGILSVGL